MNWHIEKRQLTELKEYGINPRKITEKGLKDLNASISKFGLAEPIIVNLDNTIIGGHARFKALQSQNIQECDVYVPDRLLDEKEVKELNIRLNKNIAGEFDFDILANHFETEDLLQWGFEEFELGVGDEFTPVDSETQGKLDEKKSIECPNCGHKFTS